MSADALLVNPETPNAKAFTHTKCVAAAALYISKRYPVTLPEFFTHNAELPDVIGFKNTDSVVVECKVSRGDFFADRKKSFRIKPEEGMGDWRYYCCQKDLIRKEEVPDGWGLLYVYPNGKVREVKSSYVMPPADERYDWRTSGRFKKDMRSELYLLYYYARRAFYAGVHDAVLAYRGTDG